MSKRRWWKGRTGGRPYQHFSEITVVSLIEQPEIGETPSRLLMQREIRLKLPSQESLIAHEDDFEVRQVDKESKKKGKEYADKKRRATEKSIHPGDFVLVQQKDRNKFSTTFGKKAVKVIKVNGSQIVFQDKEKQIHQRNSAHEKKIPKPINLILIHEEIDNHLSTANKPLYPEPQQQNPIIQNRQVEEPYPPHPLRRSNRNRKPSDYYQAENNLTWFHELIMRYLFIFIQTMKGRIVV